MQIQISWLLQTPTDLDLHCLQNRIYPGSAGQGLNRVQFCTLFHDALHLCEFLSKYLKLFPTNRAEYMVETAIFNIGVKHGFSCINICQVLREVLKTSLGTWRILMHWKTMFDSYYCIKSENICSILRYFLHYFVSPFHRCLANAISSDYAHSRARHYTSRDGSNSVAPVQAYWKLRSRALTARELIC